jgi:hypothetical protein
MPPYLRAELAGSMLSLWTLGALPIFGKEPLPDMILHGRVFAPGTSDRVGPSLPGKIIFVGRSTSGPADFPLAECDDLTPLDHDPEGIYVAKIPRRAAGAIRGMGERFLMPGERVHAFVDLNGNGSADPEEEVPETSQGQITASDSIRQVVFLDLNRTHVDSDNDGLPDDWERSHFGNLAAHPEVAAAKDGVSNFLSMAMGLDPIKPKAHLMPFIKAEPDSSFAFYFRLAAATTPTVVTAVSSDSLDGPWPRLNAAPVEIGTWEGSTLYRLAIPEDPGPGKRFFRLQVEPISP